jgi:SprT-like family
MTNTLPYREAWLASLVERLKPLFAPAIIPANLRVACGWPSHGATRTKGRVIGQCWGSTSSKDGHYEIFVSPILDDPMRVAGVLAHELVHAVVGVQAKHGKEFKQLATRIGLTGKMTATTEGEAFRAALVPILADLGPYPHAELSASNSNRPKQSTRLLKAECGSCGYTVRITRKWIDEVGAPHCPEHGEMQIA